MSAIQLNHVRNNAATLLEVTSAVVTMDTKLKVTKSLAKVEDKSLLIQFIQEN